VTLKWLDSYRAVFMFTVTKDSVPLASAKFILANGASRAVSPFGFIVLFLILKAH